MYFIKYLLCDLFLCYVYLTQALCSPLTSTAWWDYLEHLHYKICICASTQAYTIH